MRLTVYKDVVLWAGKEKKMSHIKASIENERHIIGGNMPPPEMAFSMEVDELFSMLSDTLAGGEVSNDDQETAIAGLMDDFRRVKGDADQVRKRAKKPYADAAKGIDGAFKPVDIKADRGILACRNALTPYRQEKLRQREAEAQRLREEADAARLKAQVDVFLADDLEEKFAAEVEFERVKKLTAAANKIDRSAKGTKTVWSAHIEDFSQAVKFLMPKYLEQFEEVVQKLANKEARTTRGAIPGIKYTSEDVAI